MAENQKTSFIKKFLYFMRHLIPDAQTPNPKLTFYHPLLVMPYFQFFHFNSIIEHKITFQFTELHFEGPYGFWNQAKFEVFGVLKLFYWRLEVIISRGYHIKL